MILNVRNYLANELEAVGRTIAFSPLLVGQSVFEMNFRIFLLVDEL